MTFLILLALATVLFVLSPGWPWLLRELDLLDYKHIIPAAVVALVLIILGVFAVVIGTQGLLSPTAQPVQSGVKVAAGVAAVGFAVWLLVLCRREIPCR